MICRKSRYRFGLVLASSLAAGLAGVAGVGGISGHAGDAQQLVQVLEATVTTALLLDLHAFWHFAFDDNA